MAGVQSKLDLPGGMTPLPHPGFSIRVPIHKLVSDGLAKQVGPRIWKIGAQDILLEVYGERPIILSANWRYASISPPEFNHEFQQLIPLYNF